VRKKVWRRAETLPCERPRRPVSIRESLARYYYAPGGKYVLFLDLLGFTAFVRSSFQKKAEETDDREKELRSFAAPVLRA